MTSAASLPPNASDVDTPQDTGTRRASLTTTSTSHSGSRSRKLTVGGTTPLAIDSARVAASIAPAADRQWPTIDLIDVTGRRLTRSPNTDRKSTRLNSSHI